MTVFVRAAAADPWTDQPEFRQTLANMLDEMRRRRLAGEFTQSAPFNPEQHGRADYDYQRWED